MPEEKAALYFLKSEKVSDLLKALSAQYSVYVPRKTDESLHYEAFSAENSEKIILGEIRPSAPLKSFFFPALEMVAVYFGEGKPGKEEKPLALVGVKSCDLHSLKVFDRIYKEEDLQDPTYLCRRRDNLIISSDCTCCAETCFCELVGVDPYPESGFDLNLSEVESGYVITAGTKKGKEIIRKNSGLFSPAGTEKIQEKDKKRKELKEQLNKVAGEYRLKAPYEELLRKKFASSVWKETTKTCVECGACVLTCPTCYCFILSDQEREGRFERNRSWDSCQYAGFARVAGGANPRRKLYERLRYRYLHKFDFLKKSYDLYACTGCGRCIQACMGKIDMRKVFKELEG